MTRPPFLPPLPVVPAPAPPDGFAGAVRAAGRRRLRGAGAAAGGTLAVGVLLTLPGGSGGTAGLHPTTDPPAAPTETATASPAGAPSAGTSSTPSPEGPTPTGAPDPADPHPSGRATPSPQAPPLGPVFTAHRPPWTRGDAAADAARTATCVDTQGGAPGTPGTRYGGWCLTAFASEQPAGVLMTLEACLVPDAVSARVLAFADGRELDFDVLAGDTGLWSSATGREFPAHAAPVYPRQGRCALWRLAPWDRTADDGSRVPAGEYVVRITLRLDGAAPADAVRLTLGE